MIEVTINNVPVSDPDVRVTFPEANAFGEFSISGRVATLLPLGRHEASIAGRRCRVAIESFTMDGQLRARGDGLFPFTREEWAAR